MPRVSFPFPLDPIGQIIFKSFSDPKFGTGWIAEAEAMVRATPGEGFSCVLGDDSDESATGALIEIDGEVVGWLVLFVLGDGSVVLQKILVVSSHRGQGVGTRVADMLIETAKGQGCMEFSVQVHDHLLRARDYWKRFAWQRGMTDMGALYTIEF